MRLPVIRGVIDRRILVNYRVVPEVLARTLPPPFRPRIYHGFGVAGICLIRLRGMRPWFLPRWIGMASENAAHRTAVEWDGPEGACQGVYVRRRDSNSWMNAMAGGRLFPGIHFHSQFTVQEAGDHLEVSVRSDDGTTRLDVVGDVCPEWPAGSVFGSLAEASDFFEAGSLGYSDTPEAGRFQGMELRCRQWRVVPLAVSAVRSSLFDNRQLFPEGTIAFDSALVMRGIEHEWHSRSDLCCGQQTQDLPRNISGERI